MRIKERKTASAGFLNGSVSSPSSQSRCLEDRSGPDLVSSLGCHSAGQSEEIFFQLSRPAKVAPAIAEMEETARLFSCRLAKRGKS